jgi:histone-lysine N-methyltransferase SUV39H
MITSCYINDGDQEKPLLVVFTQQDVEPWGELSFSYSGVSDEDVAVSTIAAHWAATVTCNR